MYFNIFLEKKPTYHAYLSSHFVTYMGPYLSTRVGIGRFPDSERAITDRKHHWMVRVRYGHHYTLSLSIGGPKIQTSLYGAANNTTSTSQTGVAFGSDAGHGRCTLKPLSRLPSQGRIQDFKLEGRKFCEGSGNRFKGSLAGPGQSPGSNHNFSGLSSRARKLSGLSGKARNHPSHLLGAFRQSSETSVEGCFRALLESPEKLRLHW